MSDNVEAAGAAMEAFVRAKIPRYSDESIARQDAAIARDIERERIRIEREIAEEAARDRSAGLVSRSDVGEAYLRSRGLDAAALLHHARFDRDGNPALSLHHLETGEVVNVVRRVIAPGNGPKCIGLRGCGVRGSFIHRTIDVQPDGLDVAVVVEGVTDSLAAVLAFPTCAILGAHSAGSIPSLVEAVVPRVIDARGWLVLVPHNDSRDGAIGAGERNTIAAARHAIAAGLALGKSLRIVDLERHKDLADAWAAGWRWSW